MNELQKTKEMTPAVAEYAGKIAEVIQMKAVVQDLLRSQMKEDVHYGKIPGTGDKPTLLKPGAEMLKMVFGLKTYSTKKDIKISKEDNNHKTYEILVHIVIKDNTVATGLGCCSTLESKYRYRSKITDIPVPKEYWENRDNNLLGGQQFSPRKIKGSWLIAERIEHDNPADYYNTVKKMAKKRAMADGILTATGSSDLFTQDLEDLNANWQVYDGIEEKRKNKAPGSLEGTVISGFQTGKYDYALKRGGPVVELNDISDHYAKEDYKAGGCVVTGGTAGDPVAIF